MGIEEAGIRVLCANYLCNCNMRLVLTMHDKFSAVLYDLRRYEASNVFSCIYMIGMGGEELSWATDSTTAELLEHLQLTTFRSGAFLYSSHSFEKSMYGFRKEHSLHIIVIRAGQRTCHHIINKPMNPWCWRKHGVSGCNCKSASTRAWVVPVYTSSPLS